MFLKTYKKITRIAWTDFSKNTKLWPKMLRLRRLRDLQHFLSPNSAVSAESINKTMTTGWDQPTTNDNWNFH